MNRLKYIKLCRLVMLGFIASLVACNKEPVGTLPDGQALIAFNSSVTETKATIDDLKNNHFQVWGGYADKVVFDGVEVRYDNENSIWTYDNHENTYWTNDAYNFYAIYPKSLATSPELANGGGISYDANTKSFTISNYNIKDSDLDLLIATVEDHKYEDDGTSVPLNFRHAFAQVYFQGKKDKDVSKVTITNFSLYGIQTVGSYSSETGRWTLSDRSTSDSPLVSVNNKELTTSLNNIFDGSLVFPSFVEIDYELKIAYKIGEDEQEPIIVKLATSSVNSWEAGKKYTYTFTVVDPNEIIFDAPKVTPWSEGNGNIIIVE